MKRSNYPEVLIKNSKIRVMAERIFYRLIDDIRGRKGLGDELDNIDDDIIFNEIKPEWLIIIAEEVLDGYSNSIVSQFKQSGAVPLKDKQAGSPKIILKGDNSHTPPFSHDSGCAVNSSTSIKD